MSMNLWIILLGGLATYLTRIGGHIVLSQFNTIHPRVQAGLEAVPAAVLTTLVAPAAMNGGPAEWAALLAAAIVGLRGPMFAAFVAGAAVLVAMRHWLS
ncbi:AzlD family protein [Tianweitania sp. BSSL-BM11]|uniref:AzlD family protein n=1 Tax=Tianweitania aestuarii TaxID=2814886 RepID=A0ABS5RV29_9HYPH|nr:AzlD family protein [Tianweitania aestuarii]MBS9720908.1 AzlD family protein [Tianweitania aestuarii]